MGRYLLCGKEATIPYEVEELDLRLYTIEELCYYIYHYPALVDDDFIGERLLSFIEKELELPEIAKKIRRFYASPSDQDATLMMLLSEVGYYSDTELVDFQSRLVFRRRKNPPERVMDKANALRDKARYMGAVRLYRQLAYERNDVRVTPELRARALEAMAGAYGKLGAFDRSLKCLSDLYDDTKSEKVLKKMYSVAVLSGAELPEKYFSKVTDRKLSEWQHDYWNQETIVKSTLEEDETLQMFFKDPTTLKTELAAYVEDQKEACRGMLE